MRLSHDPGTDTATIEFGTRPGVGSFDLCDGVVVHLDADGQVAAIGIGGASRKLDLGHLREDIGDMLGYVRSRAG